MLKKIITSMSMLVSGLTFAQSEVTTEDQKTVDQEIAEACGDLDPLSDDFKECVAIVSMDLTVVPHNLTTTGGCPGSCTKVK